MEWKQLLNKHGKAYNDFLDRMAQKWAEVTNGREITPELEKEMLNYRKQQYAIHLNDIYQETVAAFEREGLKQEEKRALIQKAKENPENEYYRRQVIELTGMDNPKKNKDGVNRDLEKGNYE